MKRLLASAFVAALVAGGVGCKSSQCNDCGSGHRGHAAHRGQGLGHHGKRNTNGGPQMGDGGGPAAQVAYPYYTTRGPRDYFANDPGYPSN